MKSNGSIRALRASSRKSFGTRRRALPFPLIEPDRAPRARSPSAACLISFLFSNSEKNLRVKAGPVWDLRAKNLWNPPGSEYLLLQKHVLAAAAPSGPVLYAILSFFLSFFFLSSLNIVREPLCER